MALNTAIAVTVYNFDATGNKFRSKELRNIPLPAEVVPAVSPDPSVFVYSKLLYSEGGRLGGMLKEAYTAETVSQILTRMNA